MENKSSNILLTVIVIATLLIAVVGATFAYFSATSSSTPQNVKTGKLVVSTTTGSVQGTNIKPVEASALDEPWASIKANGDIVKIPITVSTSGTTITTSNEDKIIADLDIYLTAVSGFNKETYTNGEPSDIKWKLVKSSDGSGTETGSFSKTISEYKLTSKNSIPVTSDVTNYEYTLLVYIENKSTIQDDLQNMTLSATVRADVNQRIGS